jgi:membrane protease YdiL (CAAX protease family)
VTLKTNRKRLPGWVRVAIAAISFLAAVLMLNQFTALLTGGDNPPERTELLIYLAATTAFASLVVVWLFRTRLDRKSFASLGFARQHTERLLAAGSLTATAIVCLSTLLLLAGGYIRFWGVDFSFAPFAMALMSMALIAFGEEIFFRGYVLSNLKCEMPPWAAILLSAGLFTLAHTQNPGITLLPLLSVFTAGLLLGIIYLATSSMWACMAFHFAWNLLIGPVLGYQVSGLQVESIFQMEPNGPAWITGSDFGLEGSALTTLLNLAAGAFLLRFAFFAPKTQRQAGTEPRR